ncbi:MAG: hypothetical protein FJW23_15290 [Acidimicrobiia bacterium]|nr:hypothetical protein [Acidimicrobiia bacterium]
MTTERIARLVACGVATLVLAAVPGAAAAQGVGVRAGVSADPDQFVFGGHLETDPLVEALLFRPSVEIGLGDNLTVIGLNVEFAYKVPIENGPWNVYFGGGPALNIWNRDDDLPGPGGTNTGGGFNILVGLGHAGGLFGEFKVGAIDSPDLKFLVGFTFD